MGTVEAVKHKKWEDEPKHHPWCISLLVYMRACDCGAVDKEEL